MSNASQRGKIAELSEQVKILSEKILSQQALIERQQRYINQLLERMHSSKSERFDPSQMQFDGLVIDAVDQAASQPAQEPPAGEVSKCDDDKPARPKRRYNRLPMPEHAERIEIIQDIPESQKQCRCCGKPLTRIGAEVTERLDYSPATMKVNKYIRPKYACSDCTCEGDGVKIATAPHVLIEKSTADAGLLAQVMVSKFYDHLPLYRQEYILQRHGVVIPRQTMWEWELQVAEGMAPLLELLKKDALSTGVALSDDTPVRLLSGGEPGSRTGRMWVGVGGENFDLCVYDFTRNRSQDGPLLFFKGYRGKLVSDAYSGYEPLFDASPDITPCGCWTHTRRYFVDSLPTCPEPAAQLLALIGELYRVEAKARDLRVDARLELRQQEAVPQMARIEQWVKEHAGRWLPQSPMGEGMEYIDNQWDRLQVYLSDGRVPIDNNTAERALRPLAIGRKNWMFFASEAGGRAAAVLFSFMQTCKLLKLDPWKYLRDVISRIAGHPASRLRELLPHEWKLAHPEALVASPT
jgi:transposase